MLAGVLLPFYLSQNYKLHFHNLFVFGKYKFVIEKLGLYIFVIFILIVLQIRVDCKDLFIIGYFLSQYIYFELKYFVFK